MTFKRWWKDQCESWQRSWCQVVHFRHHERVYKGRGCDYMHCNECNNNWIVMLRCKDYPKYRYKSKGPSLFRSTDDVQ